MKADTKPPKQSSLFETYSQNLWAHFQVKLAGLGDLPPHFFIPDIHRLIMQHTLPAHDLELIDLLVNELKKMPYQDAESPGALIGSQIDFNQPAHGAADSLFDLWRQDARTLLTGLFSLDALVRLAMLQNGGDPFDLKMGLQGPLTNAPCAGSA